MAPLSLEDEVRHLKELLTRSAGIVSLKEYMQLQIVPQD